MRMVIAIKDSLKTIILTGKDFILGSMVSPMMDSFSKASSMDTEDSISRMKIYTKESINIIREMEMAFTVGKTVRFTKESSRMTKSNPLIM